MASEPKIEVVLGSPYVGEYICYTYFMNKTLFDNHVERYDIMKNQVVKMLARYPNYEKYYENVQFVDNPKELQYGFDDVLRTGVGYLITIAIKPIHQKKKTAEQKLAELQKLMAEDRTTFRGEIEKIIND